MGNDREFRALVPSPGCDMCFLWVLEGRVYGSEGDSGSKGLGFHWSEESGPSGESSWVPLRRGVPGDLRWREECFWEGAEWDGERRSGGGWERSVRCSQEQEDKAGQSGEVRRFPEFRLRSEAAVQVRTLGWRCRHVKRGKEKVRVQSQSSSISYVHTYICTYI
jgi:hypothetical protein